MLVGAGDGRLWRHADGDDAAAEARLYLGLVVDLAELVANCLCGEALGGRANVARVSSRYAFGLYRDALGSSGGAAVEAWRTKRAAFQHRPEAREGFAEAAEQAVPAPEAAVETLEASDDAG